MHVPEEFQKHHFYMHTWINSRTNAQMHTRTLIQMPYLLVFKICVNINWWIPFQCFNVKKLNPFPSLVPELTHRSLNVAQTQHTLMVCLQEVQATSERTCSTQSGPRGHSSATKTLPTGLVKPAIPDTSEKGARGRVYIYLYKLFLLFLVGKAIWKVGWNDKTGLVDLDERGPAVSYEVQLLLKCG